MSKLKDLYKQLMEPCLMEPWLKDWHNGYKNLYSQVEEFRTRINAGEVDLSQGGKDYAFLEKLIYKQNNGMADVGSWSKLTKPNFKSFIEDNKFISPLQNFILEPNEKCFTEFRKAWEKQKKGMHPARINRVATACTHEVSTTVSQEKFNKVFKWLMDEEIIEKDPREKEQDWFSKNQFLMEKIYKEFSEELAENKNDPVNNKTDKFFLSQFVYILYKHYEGLSSSPQKQSVKYNPLNSKKQSVKYNPLNSKKQIVKYGPPGTGKTYLAEEDARGKFNSWKIEFDLNDNFSYDNQRELVQFHPSFSYEDFIEGLRPVLDKDKKAQLTLQNGVFKEFCIEAGKWEIDIYNLNNKLKKPNNEDELDWESLTIEELKKHKGEIEELKKHKGEYELRKGDHWDYIWHGEAPQESKVMDVIPPFFFIIDEINRAELSRVFGELMYCLEYRGTKKGMIKTQYANLNTDETGMLEIDKNNYRFFIPTNIYLIGTMNTIDRSVESFDIALRRRFIWQKIIPDIKVLRDHLKEDENPEWATLADNLKQLNDQITKKPLLGPDYQIGHAYLMNMNYPKNLTVEEVKECIWKDSIQPLLEEYLRGSGTDKETELISLLEEEFWKS